MSHLCFPSQSLIDKFTCKGGFPFSAKCGTNARSIFCDRFLLKCVQSTATDEICSAETTTTCFATNDEICLYFKRKRRKKSIAQHFALNGNPPLTNTAEKRLRMRQPYCNSIANLMRICFERFRRLKMAVKRSDFIVRLYSQISSAKINTSF